MMNVRQELDALIESTMAFANGIKRRQPIPELPVALRAAEQALADTAKRIPAAPIPITPTAWPGSERDEIRQRVSNFKAHQEKMAREREEYYLQMKARMLAPVPTIPLPTR
jgi:cytochrome c556